MSSGTHRVSTPDGDDRFAKEMLLRVREVDPEANADAVHRYGREIAEADAMLQSLDLDPSSIPLDVAFSPDWNDECTP